MPRQNRVTPTGELIAVSARGTLMGNRGCLHDDLGRIVRPYQGRRWIFCRLEFKGRRRALMTPGHYTELFFLDEATALAAGHRPCKECSADRYKLFVAAWLLANPGPALTAARLDAVLHEERLAGRQQRTHRESLSALPPGCFVTLAEPGPPYLVLADRLLPWQPHGYGLPLPHPAGAEVTVLTPRSIVKALAAGYQAAVHPSAFLAG